MCKRLQLSKPWIQSTLFLLFISTRLLAQPQPLPQYSARQQAIQKGLQQAVEQYRIENYRQAVAEAQRLNRPLEQRSPTGRVMVLRGITNTGELLYDATYSATQAAISTRTNSLYAGGSLGVSLSGSTLKDKLGIWDGGKVRSTHVEFSNGTTASRVAQIDNATTLSSHATHVSGIMMAAGVNPLVKGMAFGTNLRAYDFNNDVSEMSAAAPNLLVSNHSYGSNAGWVFSDTRTGSIQWEWWGDTLISKTEDYKFGLYNNSAVTWDQIAQNAPYYLIVKSSGNTHGSNGPAAGQPYYFGSSNKTSTDARANQNGYDQIPTYGNAKNILTVSAISNLNYGYNQPSDVVLSGFTSWGPSDDGRIKPDLAGIGVSVLSTSSESDSAYAILSGTSMSSPNVAGSILLLQELFSQRNNGQFLRSSTLKGLALHTADEAGSAPGPDYQNGWGLLNMERAGRVILNTDNNHLLNERTLTQGQTYSFTMVASGRGPLVATICWTDPAGTAAATLNDRTPKLVNDLDIRISDGTTTTLPWVLDPANPDNAATRGDNIRDNVEQVLLATPVPGKSYTVTVTHKGTLNDAKQDYALLMSGIGGAAYCASAPASTTDTKINRVQLGGIDQAGASGCTSYNSFTQTATVQSSQQIPLAVTLGTCGIAKNAVVKAFADWNLNGSFDDAGETAATSGVLTNAGVFSTTVAIPTSVQNGQIIRFRIVAVETDNAAAVTACGNYGNGETQDYSLNIVQTSNDVGVAALLSPEAGFCGQTNSDVTISVRVHNYGATSQTNVPVSLTITDANNAPLTTLTGVVPNLLAFRDGLLALTLPATVALSPGQTYKFIVATGLPTDQNAANNSLTETRTSASVANNGIFSVTRCGTDSVFSLLNTGGGTAFWYDSPTGGNLLAAGNRISVKTLPATGQFYAALNDLSGVVGPVDKTVFTGGTYSGNFGPAPLISTAVPIVIQSARLYIGTPGQLTFTVRKYDNTAISSVTLDVNPTRNQSLTATTNSQLVDDPDDQGAVYALNLKIPTAGDYKITIEYAGGASIFRSNSGVSGFPYQLKTQTGQPVVTIKGSLFTTGTTTDTLKTAWYYFYNMKIRSLDCASPQRTPVVSTTSTAATATITPGGSASICQGSGLTIQANIGAGLAYQWFLNGQAIAGATGTSFSAVTAGSYTVQVANTCAPVRSSALVVSVNSPQTPMLTASGFTLMTNAVSSIQWLKNGVPIPGATGTTYAVVQSGRYSVQGNVNGCGVAISSEVVLTILATEPTTSDEDITVYPNPATKLLTISIPATVSFLQPPTFQLTDLNGRTLHTATLERTGKIYSAVVDVSSLPGGTFFVVITDERMQRVRVKRIYKH
ncbi:GEVED domain-containing protein [Spirosoma luteum]|uniref:GEVED domain-containing protein n=1 Tax=Spirosoma luteum TaxID=431553 RepID=UPI000373AAFA|nr:GEVED domain-containing protein [Spirosoma luteum]